LERRERGTNKVLIAQDCALPLLSGRRMIQAHEHDEVRAFLNSMSITFDVSDKDAR
jgi:hypothetical protein